MRTAPTGAASTARSLTGRRPGVVSREAQSAARTLLEAPIPVRRELVASLGGRERKHVFAETLRETGSVYGLWADDPVGFVEDVLGETMWTKQNEVLAAIPRYKRVAVPAGFGVGKTHLAGRATAWAVCTQPVGTMLVVTTATRFRQVRNQLWPHIRKVVARAGLPGHADTTQWKMPDQYGTDVMVAYGFAAPPNDEAAMQGIHAIRLLLIVDEAGGIARMVGEGTNNLLTGDARLLAIGNPAMDDPGSWFEGLSEEGESEEPKHSTTTSIRIATTDSPAITGEPTPLCRECPDGVSPHLVAKHLPDQDWMDRTVDAYGEDHAYVVAKVYARFPKDGGSKVIPASWVDGGVNAPEPDVSDGRYVRLDSLGLPGETAAHVVSRGAWVRLGVDVAAGGGDEFAISRAVGDMIEVRHASGGPQNADGAKVADRVLEEIRGACALARALGSTARVHVKIDSIGVGWGVASFLERWAEQGLHDARIVRVDVRESPLVDDEGAPLRPNRKRDEMWLAMRALLHPDPATGEPRVRLRVDKRTAAQLSMPNLGEAGATGRAQVESKDSMKRRGVSSPDRAEAVLMAVYEPEGAVTRRRGLIQ